MGSLFALSFLEREKKDLPPLDWRVFLSLEENMAAAGRVSQRRFALPVVRGVWPADRSLNALLLPEIPRSCDGPPLACSSIQRVCGRDALPVLAKAESRMRLQRYETPLLPGPWVARLRRVCTAAILNDYRRVHTSAPHSLRCSDYSSKCCAFLQQQ
jgi:hypothetical protein